MRFRADDSVCGGLPPLCKNKATRAEAMEVTNLPLLITPHCSLASVVSHSHMLSSHPVSCVVLSAFPYKREVLHGSAAPPPPHRSTQVLVALAKLNPAVLQRLLVFTGSQHALPPPTAEPTNATLAAAAVTSDM